VLLPVLMDALVGIVAGLVIVGVVTAAQSLRRAPRGDAQ
jgi:hypothetical protein